MARKTKIADDKFTVQNPPPPPPATPASKHAGMLLAVINYGEGFGVITDYAAATQADMGPSYTEAYLHLPSACTVRWWGTENGLGSITHRGPTPNTVLDAIPSGLIIRESAIHGIWPVSPEAYDSWLALIAKAELTLLGSKGK